MRYRPLGKTGLKVSELSFGCASLGQSYANRKAPSRKDAIRLLRKAYDAGITFFDTAPSYGDSEEILGEALGDTDAIFCTKYEPGELSLEESVEVSLGRLHRDKVDVFLQHNVFTNKRLPKRLEDKVGLWGVSLWKSYHARILPSTQICQTPYNLVDTVADKLILRKSGVVFIARQPYARGLLCNPPWNIGEQALRFCLSNKHISTVLVGMQTEEELEQNLRWAEKGPLPLEMT